MNRRDFIGILALTPILATLSAAKENSISLKDLVENIYYRAETNKYLAVICKPSDFRDISFNLLHKSKNTAIYHRTRNLMEFPTGSSLYFVDINNIERMCGYNLHYAFVIGKIAEEDEDTVNLCLRLGNSPKLYKYSSIKKGFGAFV